MVPLPYGALALTGPVRMPLEAAVPTEAGAVPADIGPAVIGGTKGGRLQLIPP